MTLPAFVGEAQDVDKNGASRGFLRQVGCGMLVASIGSSLAVNMGLAELRAAEGETELSFGEREPLSKISAAIRANDQDEACALTRVYLDRGRSPDKL